MFTLKLKKYITGFVENGGEIILRTNYDDEASDLKCRRMLHNLLSDDNARIQTYIDITSQENLTISVETANPKPLLNMLKFNSIPEKSLFEDDADTSDHDSMPDLEEAIPLRPSKPLLLNHNKPFSQHATGRIVSQSNSYFPPMSVLERQGHNLNISSGGAAAIFNAMLHP